MDDETRLRRTACTRFLGGDGLMLPADLLGSIDPATVADVYGDDGVVAELEAHVAGLLGKPAAVFLPSGTMAQGATLRVHADARSTRTVLLHPTSHLLHHEMGGPERLHHLTFRPVGDQYAPLTLGDLQATPEPFAALLVELPAREIGGQLPAWDDLVAQVAHARSVGAAVHCDGARLWEAAAGYDREPAELAALFDTVYVSFYKGIGALAGCCVVGSATDVAQVREWRKRMGGTLFGLWPLAASALARLKERLPEMPARMDQARAIAATVGSLDGVTVIPPVPQAPMMHLILRVPAERYEANALKLATEELTWVWPKAMPTGDPGTVKVELSVGRATCGWDPADVAVVLSKLLA